MSWSDESPSSVSVYDAGFCAVCGSGAGSGECVGLVQDPVQCLTLVLAPVQPSVQSVALILAPV